MALKLPASKFWGAGKFLGTLLATVALSVQPLITLNIPSAFAVSPVSITSNTDLQNALNNQADGQVWQLAAGTYNQTTLHITKAITIVGPANGSAILQVPSTMTSGGKMIDIQSTGVVLNHLTITGMIPAAGCNDNEYGVYFENGASATIENSSITNMQDANAGLRGCQQGVAVRVGSQAAGIAANATINNVTVSGYQKAGIVVDGLGSSATILNSVVTGAGPVNYIAQNGIQVSRGATATIKGDTVTGNSYSGNPAVATSAGILLYGSGDHTVVSGDTITANQIGYYTETQANLNYLNLSGITGNTRNAVAWTLGDYAPAWIQPWVTWADAGIVGASDAIYGSDIVSTGGKLHVYGYDAFKDIPSAAQAVSFGGIVELESNQTTTSQVTLTKKLTLNGNGYTLAPSFAKTNGTNNSALSIQANGVTVKNLIEDGTHGTNLHGINVFGVTGVNLNDVTVENNNHTGLNVDASKVTVTNLTTAHNGWDGVDVDKTGAVLTVKGISHHNEVSPDIYVDNTAVGKVVDVNSQYDYANNVKQLGDRVYELKLAAPTNPYPANNAVINTDNFWFTWSPVAGATHYEWQGSQSSATNVSGSLQNVQWTGDYQHVQPTNPTLHSVGASGTWYWQVRAVDAFGIKGAWSPVWAVTIYTTPPSGLANSAPADGTYTTTAKLTSISWHAATDPYGVSYYYESSHSSATNGNGSFTNPVYQSAALVANSIPTPGTPEGTYYWHVKACDSIGNCTPWTGAWKVIVDDTAPTVTITNSVRDSNGAYTISGTSNDTAPVVVIVDGTTSYVTLPVAGIWTVTTNTLPDGAHTVTASSTDKAGNTGDATPTPYTFVALTPLVLIPTITTLATSPVQTPTLFSTTPTTQSTSTNNNQAVLGVQTTKSNDQAAKGTGNTQPAKSTSGLAWYWWWLIVLAVLLVIWWIIAALRRHNND